MSPVQAPSLLTSLSIDENQAVWQQKRSEPVSEPLGQIAPAAQWDKGFPSSDTRARDHAIVNPQPNLWIVWGIRTPRLRNRNRYATPILRNGALRWSRMN